MLPRAAKPRGAATTEQQAVEAGDDAEEEQIEDDGFGTSQLTDIDITDITVKLIIDGGKAKTLRSVQPPAELSFSFLPFSLGAGAEVAAVGWWPRSRRRKPWYRRRLEHGI